MRRITLQDLGQIMNAANKPNSPVFKVELNAEDMRLLLTKQKEAWLADGIPDYATRIDRMDRLIALLVDNKDEIAATLSKDYGRRSIEGSLFIEVLNVVSTLKYNKVHLREWMEPELHEAPFPDAVARVEFQPKGVVGVISPWNIPWLLAFSPIASIFAAGNVCMLKPSELVPRTSALMAQLVAQFFHETEITVLQGGPETGAAFAALPFDHLIYTGGTKIGAAIMGAAAKNLTPVTLELGGKSPVLVGRTADIGDVARRVMTAKTSNAGQVCLAPDYVLLPKGSEDGFVAFATKAVHDMYGALKENGDYTSIINDRHFDRLRNWTEDAKQKGARVIELNPVGEDFANSDLHRLPPSLILDVNEEMTVMQEEIFGPLLPIKTHDNIEEAITYVRNHPRPLALYYFGNDLAEERLVLDRTTSGGVTINDCLAHAFVKSFPFGGIGSSGMGAYQGKTGFLTFSHARSVYRQSRSPQAEHLIRPPFGSQTHAFLLEAITME
jgi:coniferyl-aldehyde dehydrogenase